MDFASKSTTSHISTLWLCVAIIALATVLLRLVAPMSGHMDEFDYLFVGKTLLDKQHWPTLTYIFGADFNWYPFAIADNVIGGINGARLVSLTLGLLSLVTIWFICQRLWASKGTATIAALIVSVSASHLFISRHVSYDIVSFFLFTLSMYPLLRCCLEKKHQLIWLLTGTILFTASVLSKYILLIYTPLIALILLTQAPRMAIIGGALFSISVGVYAWIFQQELWILYQNQIVAVHGSNATRFDLIQLVTGFLLIPLTLSIMAIRSTFSESSSDSKRDRLIITVCIIMALPLVGYHLHGANKISLYKHLVYSVFFLSLPAAWVINKFIQSLKQMAMANQVLPIVTIAFTIHSTLQFHSLRNAYPDIRDMLSVATPLLGESTTILSEDPYLFRYLQFGHSEQNLISETGWLDFNQDGRYEKRDVELALQARHFELVFLNDQIDPDSNNQYRQLLNEANYQAMYYEPYTLSSVMTNNRSGHISLYQRMKLPTLTPLTEAAPE